MIAGHGTAAHVEELVSKYRRCKRAQERRNAARQHASRELKWFHDEDGSLVIHGRFPPEQGALILKALKRATERRDRDIEGEREYLRAAAEEVETAASHVGEVVSAETPPADFVSAEVPKHTADRLRNIRRRFRKDPAAAVRRSEPFSVRHAEALGELAESYLANEPKGSNTADRFQVVVHVSAETLKSEAADVSAETWNVPPPNPDVSAETPDLFRHLGLDARGVDHHLARADIELYLHWRYC